MLNDYRVIKYVRLVRGLTQKQFSTYMGIDDSILAKLERGEIRYSPYYVSKFQQAVKSLKVTELEMESIKIIIEEGKNHAKSKSTRIG